MTVRALPLCRASEWPIAATSGVFAEEYQCVQYAQMAALTEGGATRSVVDVLRSSLYDDKFSLYREIMKYKY